MSRFRTQLAGVAFLGVLVLLGWLAVAIYDKDFDDSELVTLRADRLGNQLAPTAEVKVKGVPFGEVRAVRSTRAGAEIDLAIDPAKIRLLPGNVSARLLPKTVFGERYVNLVLPDRPQGTLRAGDVIAQDRSSSAIELERVLGDLLPLLRAVQPQKLNSSLGAISQALDNRGKPLGDSIVELQDLLGQVNPLMPQFKADITGLAHAADVYTGAAPDILQALSDLSATAKTIVDTRADLDSLYASVTSATGHLNEFLRKNKDNLIGVSAASRPTLELLARYSPEFPCLFDAVNRLKPLMEKALGKGTNEPGLHVTLTVRDPREKYVPGRDTPRFDATGGPKCYGGGAAAAGPADGDLGPANSPGERQLVAEMLRPALEEVPDWSSVLIGPALRGTEVTVR
ncbi:MCE family protein [Amycolatopsis rifamycinica]|uniref:ABC transporter substrate-binding protein n=1 Tax=Amycolatopsis rifamycinica TaxID=287986 RepID=A0A066TZM2_9PSEU|nr:MCE family protein [Amycolatopsis rifamycinica]KDN20636.1 ABC transporter substrate-binding protein [Amycolatopsis rifamycinica]